MKKVLLSFVGLIFTCTFSIGQASLTFPEVSQLASVTQRIGLTDITIRYHSPLVKGRQIWGEVVHFGEVWRAGANENTTISFSTPALIEGKPIPEGTYGLHMIPGKESWTIIFSSNASSWGSYFYKQSEDVLRVEVKPAAASHQEWLSYRFTDIKAASALVEMHWEKIKVSFLTEVKVHETVIANMRKELRGIMAFTWEGPWQAADYCARNKVNLDEAMVWVDKSIATKENFRNLNTKADLLALKNNMKESDQVREKAMSLADEQQLNAYGYQLIANNQLEKATEIFKLNVKKYPDSWNTYDSLGEILEMQGDYKNALMNYKTAMSKAPDGQKKRIGDIIAKIEKKMAAK